MDSAFDHVTLKKGTLLFAEGDPGTSAYLIRSGRIEIFVMRNGQAAVLANRTTGEIVGEMAIIDQRPRSAHARTATDCDLVLIKADQIANRIKQADPILQMYLNVVLSRYRETIAKLGNANGSTSLEAAPRIERFDTAIGTLSVESDLRRAIRSRELELYFQPIVNLQSGRLCGFESLLRWNHPVRGLIPPDDFIPIAEASGLIVDITSRCFEEIGRTFPEIMLAALRNIKSVDMLFLTVNISGHDLASDSFLHSLRSMLSTSGISASDIKLEITESVLLNDPKKAADTLKACREMGVGIAIDDFGTGYSSLSQLGTLPMTSIKIDQSFVRSMRNNPTSRRIIDMILRLAEEMEVSVVAEGIEYVEEEAILTKLGCEYGQGFYFGKPLPLHQTLDVCRNWVARGHLDQPATPRIARAI